MNENTGFKAWQKERKTIFVTTQRSGLGKMFSVLDSYYIYKLIHFALMWNNMGILSSSSK